MIIAAALAASYVLLCLAMFLLQGRLVFMPSREMYGDPAGSGLAFEDVSLTTADGVKLHAWWLPAEAKGPVGQPGPATALFFHGNGGNISAGMATWRLLRDRLGLNVLALDYRGYGRSEGRPSEPGLYLDARAAWDHLVNARRVPPDRIVLWGRSLGSAVAAELAGEVRPGALILESAHTSVPELGAEAYPWLPVRLLARIKLDNLEHLKRVRCPVLVVHSPEDEMVGIGFGRRVFAAAAEPKEFLEITGTHNEGFFFSGELYAAGVERFIAKQLAAPAGRPAP